MKIKYNNYQFYENEALSNFLNEKKSEGYALSNTKGSFLNILKFSLQKDDISTNYVVLRKYFNKAIDEKIEIMKQNNNKIISENNLYIIFEISKEEYEKLEISKIKEVQSNLLSIPVRKCLFFIAIESLIIFACIILNIKFNENYTVTNFNFTVSTALMIIFGLYFIGDVSDFRNGYGIFQDKRLYFTERSKLKNNLFFIADIFKFITLICSIIAMFIMLYNNYSDINYMFQFGSTIFICIIVFILSTVKYNNSYITLLLLSLALQVTALRFN